jgi:protein-S-isoprenylcysteine O-methyltransferase
MHLFDQRILGTIILFLLGMLVITKQTATGSILDKPKGNLLVQVVNIFNLFFLLIANPLVAILLITGHLETFDPTRLSIGAVWLLMALESMGLLLYLAGYFLMAWALISLRGNYQLGGSLPRIVDKLIVTGPYRFVRNPMYTAALCIAQGLACLTQSLACFVVFCIYLVLIVLLIPVEEQGMRQAYGEQYITYQRKVKKLLPLFY